MNLTFAQPYWFWLLLFIPLLLTAKSISDNISQKHTKAYLPPHQAPPNPRRAWLWTAFILYSLAWTALTAALARPQAGQERIEATIQSRQILFVLDVSKSMLAQDITPNRLERSKLLIRDIIGEFPQDQIGLIVFAGSAFLQIPLTNDHQALAQVLDITDQEIIPRGGTNLSAAIQLGIQTFKNKNAAGQSIVLISDGDELEGTAITTAQEAKKAGIKILTVGAATAEGAIIPDPDLPGDFIRHGVNREIVRSRLQPETLQKIASATNSPFFQLSGDLTLHKQIAAPLNNTEQNVTSTKVLIKPIERFADFLIPGLALLLLGWLTETLATRAKITPQKPK